MKDGKAVRMVLDSVGREHGPMSAKTREALERAIKAIEENAPSIKEKLCNAGVESREVFVYSAAKYYDALNKLSKE